MQRKLDLNAAKSLFYKSKKKKERKKLRFSGNSKINTLEQNNQFNAITNKD